MENLRQILKFFDKDLKRSVEKLSKNFIKILGNFHDHFLRKC